jgi:hypothetical protein
MDDDIKAWCAAQRATILAENRAPPAPQPCARDSCDGHYYIGHRRFPVDCHTTIADLYAADTDHRPRFPGEGNRLIPAAM